MLKLFNSETQRKEGFVPLEKGKVRMYACGPTVYDRPHLGHLRSAYVFEVLRRYLESGFCGYEVTFVRNVTDVDDKIIDKARESGAADLNEEAARISGKYLSLYQEALAKIGVRTPTVEPKATAHIPEMIDLIGRLLAGGSAYVSGGDVYFSVGSFSGYGKLSHQQTHAMLENCRVDRNEQKKDPLDFALWKSSKPGEPFWESPWGRGRPGWHIECSAMSMKYLGPTLDIHGGGRDLLFPHHENEVAQSEASTRRPFARYWVHHGLVTINAQKMSKSLKNFLTVEDIEARGPWALEDLKFLFLATHYGAPLDFTEERIRMQSAVREGFYRFFEEADQLEGAWASASNERTRAWEDGVREALDDDLNTSLAITRLHEVVRDARLSKDGALFLAARDLLKRIGSILGIFSADAAPPAGEREAYLGKIRERKAARDAKDFEKADRIRNELLERGIALTDWPGGTTSWRRL